MFASFKPDYSSLSRVGGVYSAWRENEARRIATTIFEEYAERTARFDAIDPAANITGHRYATGQGATLPSGGVDVARSRISAAWGRGPAMTARGAA